VLLSLVQKEKADRYEVVGKLGEGGFGLVFVVLDKRDFRQYVLKEVLNSMSGVTFCSWVHIHICCFTSQGVLHQRGGGQGRHA
jgi:hypothetical protein